MRISVWSSDVCSSDLPAFRPLDDKFRAFGWEATVVDGHDGGAVIDAVDATAGGKPLVVIGRTTKGKGVSYMENQPIWHYRSPSPEEYRQALTELRGVGRCETGSPMWSTSSPGSTRGCASSSPDRKSTRL